MPKYEVTLKEIEMYKLEIEADNKDEAVDMAWEILTGDDEKKVREECFYDSYGDHEIEEID